MQLTDFHPAVAGWFNETFDSPTEVQLAGWRAIREGSDTLIAAPTGSGKTLAAFLVVLDDLARRAEHDELSPGIHVVYVSPLRALSNDIEANLQRPLAAISERLQATGVDTEIRVGLRTGDTPAHERAKMVRNPPHILVSTPESLFILLGSDSGRAMLRNTRAVIIDEVHALTPDRRGAHLSLTLERLQQLSPQLVRIGLSATQRPIELTGRFLVGARRDMPQIIDAGHVRDVDLAVEVLGSPLGPLMSEEAIEEVYERLTELIKSHKTTLVFTNTRREAERIAYALEAYIGAGLVTSHHGALSKERRHAAETALRLGELKALVATSSLELGIDIGDVDLVCQIGSVKSMSALLQRVGRSGHSLRGTPKGRIFPMTLDELVEATALLKLQRDGELDLLDLDDAPLDLLAQHIVAMAGNGEWEDDTLFEVVRGAANYADLPREKFDAVLAMLADGFTTRRGRRRAYIHWDRVNARIRGRRNARLTALTSGGAIPERADFRVVLDHNEVVVGTLDEEFAVESRPGDIFLLGNMSWGIAAVSNREGVVRVFDAHGAPPTLPFWIGEAPARTTLVSAAVSDVRASVDALLRWDEQDVIVTRDAMRWVQQRCGLDRNAAEQLVSYLAATRIALSVMPTQQHIVVERFFDETNNTHLVIHSPFGGRLNRAWGLALRKSFCRSFNFELQAAANEDAIILSMGPTHSFPLEEVFDFVSSTTVRDVLVQALLDSPLFGTRWRWNLNRSLAVPRFRNGKKYPPAFQRMEAEDLLAVIFPDQLACLENIQGDRTVPDHPLVEQTISDCLHEAMDIDALESLLTQMEHEEVRTFACDVREPSPMAHQIIHARPHAFLDDAPLEERRAAAVQTRGMLDPRLVSDLADLDTEAVDRVRAEVAPELRDADEVHDALLCHGYMTADELTEHQPLLSALRAQRRVDSVGAGTTLWFAVERAAEIDAVLGPVDVPTMFRAEVTTHDALVELLRSRLEYSGPITTEQFVAELGTAALDVTTIQAALLTLEASGFVFRGAFDTREPREQWCERTLLARIHRYTLSRLRREIEPVSPVDFMRFLFDWQHVSASTRMRGPDGVAAVIEQLSGVDVAAAAWESEVLHGRVIRYEPSWLDMACLSGKFIWGRVRGGAGRAPVKNSPIALLLRTEVDIWTEDATVELSPLGQRVVDVLATGGARFFDDLATECRVLPTQLQEVLGELVAAGYVTSDSFSGLRALISKSRAHYAQTGYVATIATAGRWALLRRQPPTWSDADVERVARRLLRRWGVVVRAIARREAQVGWRRLLSVLRTMEARGEVRGGRFVNGVGGEQFALPEALATLRQVRRATADGELISISACDPLNLTGVLIGETRIPSTHGHRIVWRDGAPIAVWDGRKVDHLVSDNPVEVERLARQLPATARALSDRDY